MSSYDKAFELTHEDLIKCTSILLYKFNLEAQKNQLLRSEHMKLVNQKVEHVEATFKSQILEINEFLHTIHMQLDTYTSAHKKEHVTMNEKIEQAIEQQNSLEPLEETVAEMGQSID